MNNKFNIDTLKINDIYDLKKDIHVLFFLFFPTYRPYISA